MGSLLNSCADETTARAELKIKLHQHNSSAVWPQLFHKADQRAAITNRHSGFWKKQRETCVSIIAIGLTGVQALTQFLAGLEKRHPFFLDEHGVACSRIAAGSRRTVLDREGTEAAQFDAISGSQRIGDFIQNGIDDILDIAVIEMWIVRSDNLHQF
jgi:hypothetical protein